MLSAHQSIRKERAGHARDHSIRGARKITGNRRRPAQTVVRLSVAYLASVEQPWSGAAQQSNVQGSAEGSVGSVGSVGSGVQ